MRHKKYYWGLAILITLLVDTVCILFLFHKYIPQETFNLFEAFFISCMSWDREYSFVQDAESYFFEIEGKDPPSEFMDRFSGHSPLIKKGSNFVADDFDNNTGIFFRIDSWRWHGWGWLMKDRAAISGGFDIPNRVNCATYIFKRGKKGWAWDVPKGSFIGNIEIPIPLKR